MGLIFETADDFEALFTRMFDQIAVDDPSSMQSLVAQRMVVCFRLREPDIELWVDGREEPVATSFGPQLLDPTLTADLSGNTMHALLLGTLPLGRALLFRKLKVKGSKTAAMKLEDLFHSFQAVYPGLADGMLGET